MNQKISKAPDLSLGPVPAMIMTLGTGEEENMIAVAWTGIVNNDPPMVYVSVNPSRFSYPVLKKTGEFVLNVVSPALLQDVDFTGSVSGRDIDKWEATGLTKEPARKLACCGIWESPVQYECKVTKVIELPSHVMFLAEIVNVNIDPGLIDGRGDFHPEHAGLVAYMNGRYVETATEPVCDTGYTLNGQLPYESKIEAVQVYEMGLPEQICRKLYEARLYNIGDLRNVTKEYLLSLPGFGKKTVDAIIEAMAEYGTAPAEDMSVPAP